MKKHLWLLLLLMLLPLKGFTQSTTPAASGQVNVTNGSGGYTLQPYGAGGSTNNQTIYLNATSELGAQFSAAVTTLAGLGGVVVLPRCLTPCTWSTAVVAIPPNISIFGYGQRATQILCSTNCLTMHEPVDWASTSLAIGSEIAGFTMIGTQTTASNQVLISLEGANGFTIHDVAFNGADLTHEPTCFQFRNTTTDQTFSEHDTTYNFTLGQACLIGVHFLQDVGDGLQSFAYNNFDFFIAPTGPSNGLVFDGAGLLYGGTLRVQGNYVGTGGNLLLFNNSFETGSPGGASGSFPIEQLFISVENNSNDGTAHMVKTTGTNILNFSGEIFNGSPSAFGFSAPFSFSGGTSWLLSGPLGAQTNPASGAAANDLNAGTASGSSVRSELCPNVSGSCQIFIGHDTGTGNQATFGFNYISNDSTSSRGYLGTFGNNAFTWDINGNVFVTASATATHFKVGTSEATVATTPTVGQAACIKAAGPPVVIGFCSTVVSSGGACTCN